jgi:hypothetical protein
VASNVLPSASVLTRRASGEAETKNRPTATCGLVQEPFPTFTDQTSSGAGRTMH